MKRVLLSVCALLAVGLVMAFYFQPSVEVKRDRYLKRAREYVNKAKVNEAVIEFKNALKADPASAEALQGYASYCS